MAVCVCVYVCVCVCVCVYVCVITVLKAGLYNTVSAVLNERACRGGKLANVLGTKHWQW